MNFLLIALLIAPQEPAEEYVLQLGTIQQQTADDVPQVPSEYSVPEMGGLPLVWAATYRIEVKESGVYHIDCRSYDFDPCLILEKADGTKVSFDSDGLVEFHSRIVHTLDADVTYRLHCLGSYGSRGKYSLSLVKGEPPKLTEAQFLEQDRQEWAARLSHLEKREGESSLTVFDCLSDRGMALYQQRRMSEAVAVMKSAMELAEELFGEEADETAGAMNNYAFALQMTGNFIEAEPLLLRAIEITEATLGADHPETATSLNNYCILLRNLSQFEKAIPYCQRALEIRQNTFGLEHQSTANSLNSLATLYYSQGSYEIAAPLYRQALELRKSVLGPKHPRTAQSLNNLAALERAMGDRKNAEDHYRQALAIIEEVAGPNHPQTSANINNLGLLLFEVGKMEEAEQLLRKALAIREGVHGPTHPNTANTLNNLAALLKSTKNWEDAKPLLQRSLEIRERLFGVDHPMTSATFNDIADIHEVQDQFPLALDLRTKALAGSLAYLQREFPTMTEAARWRQLVLVADPEAFLGTLLKGEPEELVPAYSLFLKWKGLSTRMQVAGMRWAKHANSPEVIQMRGALQSNAKQLSQLVLLPSSNRPKDIGERLAELREKQRGLERKLNRAANLASAFSTPDYEMVMAAIADGDALVDFFVGDQVYAWVLVPGKEISLVALGDRAGLKEAVDGFLRGTVVRGGRALSTQEDPASKLQQVLWQPLSALIGDARHVYICPDSFLGKLPFGVIAQSNGQYLIEKHRFVYQSDATRVTTYLPSTEASEGSILAVGDVNYYERVNDGLGTTSTIERSSGLNSHWPPLDGTRQELQALQGLHQYALKWESPFLRIDGPNATEERVRQELAGKRYVHVATHGYFEPDHLPSLLHEAQKAKLEVDLGEQVLITGTLPNLLSGLVFAGVNGERKADHDDGYLSAEEIQHLDLSACDLAVLSACETALGSERAGEGLMSLRRAFEIGGANSVISSLWKVNDQATADLMSNFYRNLWVEGLSKVEALHQAKLSLLYQNRNRLPEGEGDPSPETWGSFILSGNWR